MFAKVFLQRMLEQRTSLIHNITHAVCMLLTSSHSMSTVGASVCPPGRPECPARGFHAICVAASLLTPCQRTLEGVFQRKGDGHGQLNEDRASLCCGRGKGCRRFDHH